MSLPKTFKFKANDEPQEIFYASVSGENVFVDWDNNDGRPANHSLETAKKYIEKGYWEIIVENDNVNHPSHYQGKTEVIDIIEQATTNLNGFHAYCLGNVIKYVMRHQKKGGIEDLKKASWYLNRVIGGESE
jgi:hypothetical protein